MLIRLATPQDAPVIHEIFRSAFGPFKEKYTSGAYAHTVVKEEVIKYRMSIGKTWLAEVEGRPLGTVSVMETWEGHYVAGMAVLPEAQGKQMAYKLMCELEAFALSNGEDRLYLYTTPFLHKAISLYEKFGFTRYGNPTDEYLGTNLIQFEKDISKN